MADRVAIGRIVFGHGDQRRTISAGTRFNTDTLGIDQNEVRRMEQRGILRRPRDDVRIAPTAIGPGASTDEEVTEGRSGGASNVRSGAAQQQMADDNATGDVSGAAEGGETAPRTGAETETAATRGGRRGKPSDLDL
jgi:hypothetical protein